jgi:hypothetical protein
MSESGETRIMAAIDRSSTVIHARIDRIEKVLDRMVYLLDALVGAPVPAKVQPDPRDPARDAGYDASGSGGAPKPPEEKR